MFVGQVIDRPPGVERLPFAPADGHEDRALADAIGDPGAGVCLTVGCLDRDTVAIINAKAFGGDGVHLRV